MQPDVDAEPGDGEPVSQVHLHAARRPVAAQPHRAGRVARDRAPQRHAQVRCAHTHTHARTHTRARALAEGCTSLHANTGKVGLWNKSTQKHVKGQVFTHTHTYSAWRSLRNPSQTHAVQNVGGKRFGVVRSVEDHFSRVSDVSRFPRCGVSRFNDVILFVTSQRFRAFLQAAVDAGVDGDVPTHHGGREAGHQGGAGEARGGPPETERYEHQGGPRVQDPGTGHAVGWGVAPMSGGLTSTSNERNLHKLNKFASMVQSWGKNSNQESVGGRMLATAPILSAFAHATLDSPMDYKPVQQVLQSLGKSRRVAKCANHRARE